MPAFVSFGELKSRRYGPIVFSPGETMKSQRKRVGYSFGVDRKPIPLQQVYKVFTADPMEETLLAFRPDILPEELRHCFEVAELEDDLDKMCADVVFCSHLRDASLEPPQWIDGFVIENGRFSPDEVIDLSRQQTFLPYPYNVVFVNGYTADGSPLDSGLDFFKTIVHYVGFLKARAQLLANGLNPDSILPNIKEYAACCYEFKAAANMLTAITMAGQTSQAINEPIYLWQTKTMARILMVKRSIPPAQLHFIGSAT